MRKYLHVCLSALLVAVACLAGALAIIPSPVLAIADPDTPPAINGAKAWELEDGGLGILVDYNLDYAVLPTETATESYMAVFVDTDGITQLKSAAPYTFVDSGYGRGLIWIQFTAAEVSTYSLTSASMADYRVWLVGNPTVLSGWAGDPPKTVALLDDWDTYSVSGLSHGGLGVLYYADVLELAWSLDMIEATAIGNRLTATGESYFLNVIPDLRSLAPNAFSNTESKPNPEDIDYSTTFSATATSESATLVGSPVTLARGANSVNTGATTGTFTITLSQGTSGTIANGTGTLSSSPSDLVYGTNTVTATGAGTFTITLALSSAQERQDTEVSGTGMDVTPVATIFGMSRTVFGGIVWLIVSALICGAVYGIAKRGALDGGASAGKVVMLVFGICIIGGVLLGMLAPIVAALLFIGYGAFTGYVIFFRNSGGDIGKTVMFMGYMWVVVCLAGGILQGIVPQASTSLTASISATDTTITVTSTEGFRSPGILIIDGERIAYYKKTATTFSGTFWKPLSRGASGTTATTHSPGASVRMPETALINDALDYNIALISDASGWQAFVTVPLAIFDILTTFIFLPMKFLGTDLVIITVIWAVIGLGLIISVFIAMAGGRRV